MIGALLCRLRCWLASPDRSPRKREPHSSPLELEVLESRDPVATIYGLLDTQTPGGCQ